MSTETFFQRSVFYFQVFFLIFINSFIFKKIQCCVFFLISIVYNWGEYFLFECSIFLRPFSFPSTSGIYREKFVKKEQGEKLSFFSFFLFETHFNDSLRFSGNSSWIYIFGCCSFVFLSACINFFLFNYFYDEAIEWLKRRLYYWKVNSFLVLFFFFSLITRNNYTSNKTDYG